MSMNDKSKNSFHGLHSRKTLVFVSLLFMITLASSCFASVFRSVSPFVQGVSDKVVSNETELIATINNAPFKTSIVITLGNDITLTSSIAISANKEITLTSNKLIGFYKLIGAPRQNTITVEDEGTLNLDGIIVTHANDESGRGVSVQLGGTLIMRSGEISGNTAPTSFGPVGGPAGSSGGVSNVGTFEFHGGKISNNKAVNAGGGGVGNSGTFKMYGGEISNNSVQHITITNAAAEGGGVYNSGIFEMYGGKISNNVVDFYGGGVYNSYRGIFNRFGGVISGNTAPRGGDDVYTVDTGGSSSGNNGGSSGGSGGSSNGNDDSGGNSSGSGGSGSGNSDSGSSNGNDGFSNSGDGFGVWDVVVTCVIVVVVVVGTVAGALFFYFKKKVAHVEAKFNTLTQDKTEE